MIRLTLLVSAALFIIGCGNSFDVASQDEKPGAYTVFDTGSGEIPYPNNLLFAGSADGKLKIPFDANASDASIKAGLNTLDGFSTIAPIAAPVTDGIDATSLPGHVSLFKVTAVASAATGGIPAVVATQQALTYGSDYVASVSGNSIVVIPLKPLAGNSNYMVVLTKGIRSTNGGLLTADTTTTIVNGTMPLVDGSGNATVYLDPDPAVNNATAKQLESVRQLNAMMFAQAVGNGIAREDVIMLWSFKTQTIGAVAQAISDANLSGALGLQDTHLTSSVMLGLAGENNSSLHGIAEVYAGTLSQLPYYLEGASSAYDTTPLTTSFAFNAGSALPIVRDNRTIPVLASVPKTGAMPAAGWPVVIFQHGITQNRTNLLAIAEAFAAVGFASVAIDLPLHGIDDNTSALYMGALERTFNLDLMNNDTMQAGPDGRIDASGSHYINLASLMTSRDNVRQSTSDLIALANALTASAVAADGLKFDASRTAFVGHSLGAIASFGFLTHRAPESVTLAMPGGGIAQLLNNSQTFGPVIEAGLAQAGIVKGTSSYESFMIAAQTLLDDGDPDNYAAGLTSRSLLYFEAQNDKVIPNNVATAPLSGTDPLLKLTGTGDLNLTGVTSNTFVPISGNTVALFAEPAGHGSILDPTDSLDATVEMQTELAYFLQSAGRQILVGDPSLLVP